MSENDAPRILVTGADGQVGSELRRCLANTTGVRFVTREDVDLADADGVRRLVREARPHLVINAAAYTAVDRAESDADVAMAVNGLAPQVMAEEMHALGGAMIQISTDYVFDGENHIAYVESDTPNPLSVYGKSKLAGELAVAAACPAHWTLRTSWVFGIGGSNFLKTVLRVAETRDTMRVVADQRGAPTSARRLAESIMAMLEADRHPSGAELAARVAESAGVYHVTSQGATTWHGYATHIVQRLHKTWRGRRWVLRPEMIEAIDSASYPTPARRPHNSLLNHDKLARRFHLRLPAWQADVDACLDELLDRRFG